jgi:hypothetical protein
MDFRTVPPTPQCLLDPPARQTFLIYSWLQHLSACHIQTDKLLNSIHVQFPAADCSVITMSSCSKGLWSTFHFRLRQPNVSKMRRNAHWHDWPSIEHACSAWFHQLRIIWKARWTIMARVLGRQSHTELRVESRSSVHTFSVT